jgi:MFS superfamily sulfate permease-like transporter
VLIASTQLRDLLGLRIDDVSGVFIPRLIQVAHALPTISLPSALLAAGSLLLIVTANRFTGCRERSWRCSPAP